MVTNNLQIIKSILELYKDMGVQQIPHFIPVSSLSSSSLHSSPNSTKLNPIDQTGNAPVAAEVTSSNSVISSDNNTKLRQTNVSNFTSHYSATPAPDPLPPVNTPATLPNQYEFLNSISTLEELKVALQNFNGCDLKKTAMNTVFGVGNANADIMLIGEAPGADEDIQGEPFVGRSGQLLMKALNSIGLHRENLFITNTVFWRPPGNRNPTLEEMMVCYPFLTKLINIICPKIIILVGKVATTNILKLDDPISKIRGLWYNIPFMFNAETLNVETIVVFHPAYLLRNPIKKQVLWQDLLVIKAKINELNLNTNT